jgi:hypothetical protein
VREGGHPVALSLCRTEAESVISHLSGADRRLEGDDGAMQYHGVPLIALKPRWLGERGEATPARGTPPPGKISLALSQTPDDPVSRYPPVSGETGRTDCLQALSMHKVTYIDNPRRSEGCLCVLLNRVHVLEQSRCTAIRNFSPAHARRISRQWPFRSLTSRRAWSSDSPCEGECAVSLRREGVRR